MTARTYIPTDRFRYKYDRDPKYLEPDLRVRCAADHKVVFEDQSRANHSAERAGRRGQRMKAYLGKCGHWHVARIK